MRLICSLVIGLRVQCRSPCASLLPPTDVPRHFACKLASQLQASAIAALPPARVESSFVRWELTDSASMLVL
eukprot:3079029-Rhodomonas_salina.4